MEDYPPNGSEYDGIEPEPAPPELLEKKAEEEEIERFYDRVLDLVYGYGISGVLDDVANALLLSKERTEEDIQLAVSLLNLANQTADYRTRRHAPIDNLLAEYGPYAVLDVLADHAEWVAEGWDTRDRLEDFRNLSIGLSELAEQMDGD
jgi:hypothetical protein